MSFENERVVFTNPGGSVSVVVPTGEKSINQVMVDDVPDYATNVRQITIDELPIDRIFRNAWDDSNSENFVGVNLIKAKSLSHDMRRKDRQMKLAPLDEEERFTSTTPGRKNEIVTEKQSILDVNAVLQNDIDSSSDEAALRSVLTASLLI